MKITPRDIAQEVKWSDVKKAIKYFYPDDKNNYADLFKRIKAFEPQKQEMKGEKIEIHVQDFYRSMKEKVPLKEIAEDRFYSIATNKYSMSFRKWEGLANIPISKKTLDHYMFEDILAHFIWEITFHGTEEEAEKEGEALQKIADDIRSGKAKTVPYEL